jgi:hypothetical protein
MARDIKHVVGLIFRLGLFSILGAGVMLCGGMIMLQGVWAGVFLVLIGAFLMALPAAFCLTQYLCKRLYGPSSRGAPPSRTDRLDAPIKSRPTECPFRRVIQAWLSATLHGTFLPFWELKGMRDRGTPPDVIVDAYLIIKRSNAHASIAELEDLYITESTRVHDAFDLVHLVAGTND